MKTIDFSVLDGFPASATMLQFQQEQLQQVEALALLGGNLFILQGCEVNAGIVSNGWVCIEGKVYPFAGGTVGTQVIITEEVTNKNFFGGASNPYYRVPTARFGTNGNPAAQWPWANFKRNNPANGVLARLEKVEQMLRPLMGYTANVAGVPTTVHGSWLFWGRPENEIPSGWAEVTDAEWRGRYPLLKDASNTNMANIGQLLGSSQVMLSPGHIPSLPINAPTSPDGNAAGANVYGRGGTSGGNANVQYVNNNQQPVVTLPPSRVVIFIKYVG
jgi:hypothetical protein